MKRKILGSLLMAILVISLIGCQSWKENEQEAAASTFTLTLLKGPSAAGLVKMMEPSIKPQLILGDTVEFVLEENPESLYAKLLAGEIEMAAIPTDMAARLYNEKGQYQLAAVTSGGMDYLLTNGIVVNSWADLQGKDVYLTGPISASAAVFRYLLSENGLNPDRDLTLHFVESQRELAQMIQTGNAAIVVLSEPWVSTALSNGEKVQIALDLQQEWVIKTGAANMLSQNCLVIRKDLPETKKDLFQRNPEVLTLFLEDYENSINWMNTNHAEAVELISAHDVGMPDEVAAEALPRTNLLFKDTSEAKSAVNNYLEVLYNYSPDLTGGDLPDDGFFLSNGEE